MFESTLDWLPFLVAGGVLVTVWLVLRNKATALNSTAEFDRHIGRGKPVVLKFFANT